MSLPARPRYFTPNEVCVHNTEHDLWVSFLGKVYDLTPLCTKYKGWYTQRCRLVIYSLQHSCSACKVLGAQNRPHTEKHKHCMRKNWSACSTVCLYAVPGIDAHAVMWPSSLAHSGAYKKKENIPNREQGPLPGNSPHYS